MSDAKELLERYAASACTHLAVEDSSAGHDREEFAPLAFDALRAVLDEHTPTPAGKCDVCTDRERAKVGRIRAAAWPCPTVRVITEALEGETDE